MDGSSEVMRYDDLYGLYLKGDWPMDEIEIDIIELHSLETFLQSWNHLLTSRLRPP